MRIVSTQPQLPGEYTVAKRKAGYPKDARMGWTFAPIDVQDTPHCNLQTLASQAHLIAQLQQESGALQPNINALTLRESEKKEKRKFTDESKCCVKKAFSTIQMGNAISHEFWTGKYGELQDECRAHGVSQCGAMGVMLNRLREHYKLAHVQTTFKTKTSSLSSWLKQEN